ncbi:MAG: HD domain-containing protein, partial [Parcubacteria group bacterium]|nr:HD domain-containing protein [Parcubacteria group bacterium]
TYRHSIRVAALAVRIGEYLHLPPRPLLWAGLLHDIGKILVNPRLLTKVGNFSDADYKEMEAHVEFGWRLLRGIHDWTANILVRHHHFSSRPYPAVLPSPAPPYPAVITDKFDHYARLLALADFYDALMTRKNGKFDPRLSKREIYFKENPDQQELIESLEKAGIITFSA